ncbi:hypothetical protein [Ursidibacter sp. B-7004-1]
MLGLFITVGAAVPAIAAIFSYRAFIKESKDAQARLVEIKVQQEKLQLEIDNVLPNLEQKFDSVAVLLQHNDMKKWAYEWSRKGELTTQERDERFYKIDALYSQGYDYSIYQLIVIKQQQIEQFESEIAQDKAQYGEVRLYDYQMRLDCLNQELAELYRIASLSDKDFKPLYLQQLIYIWTILADRKEEDHQEIDKEKYLTEQMKAVLLRIIQFNENNIAHIQVNEKDSKRLLEFAKEHLLQAEIDKLINPYKSSEIKFSNTIQKD